MNENYIVQEPLEESKKVINESVKIVDNLGIGKVKKYTGNVIKKTGDRITNDISQKATKYITNKIVEKEKNLAMRYSEKQMKMAATSTAKNASKIVVTESTKVATSVATTKSIEVATTAAATITTQAGAEVVASTVGTAGGPAGVIVGALVGKEIGNEIGKVTGNAIDCATHYIGATKKGYKEWQKLIAIDTVNKTEPGEANILEIVGKSIVSETLFKSKHMIRSLINSIITIVGPILPISIVLGTVLLAFVVIFVSLAGSYVGSQGQVAGVDSINTVLASYISDFELEKEQLKSEYTVIDVDISGNECEAYDNQRDILIVYFAKNYKDDQGAWALQPDDVQQYKLKQIFNKMCTIKKDVDNKKAYVTNKKWDDVIMSDTQKEIATRLDEGELEKLIISYSAGIRNGDIYIVNGMCSPMGEDYTISSSYGYRKAIYKNGKLISKEKIHEGIDVPLTEGTQVRAAWDGIAYAGSTGSRGNYVLIVHDNGYKTLYEHLSQVNITNGKSVKQGQVIALSGNTGNSTGAHLHFQLYDKTDNPQADFTGKTIDPMKFLKTGGK